MLVDLPHSIIFSVGHLHRYQVKAPGNYAHWTTICSIPYQRSYTRVFTIAVIAVKLLHNVLPKLRCLVHSYACDSVQSTLFRRLYKSFNFSHTTFKPSGSAKACGWNDTRSTLWLEGRRHLECKKKVHQVARIALCRRRRDSCHFTVSSRQEYSVFVNHLISTLCQTARANSCQ